MEVSNEGPLGGRQAVGGRLGSDPVSPQAEPQPHLAGADVRAEGVLQDRHRGPPEPRGRRPVCPFALLLKVNLKRQLSR